MNTNYTDPSCAKGAQIMREQKAERAQITRQEQGDMRSPLFRLGKRRFDLRNVYEFEEDDDGFVARIFLPSGWCPIIYEDECQLDAEFLTEMILRWRGP